MHSQKGSGALSFVTVLLLILGLTSLSTTRLAVVEQRLARSENALLQAQNIAQSGLSRATNTLHQTNRSSLLNNPLQLQAQLIDGNYVVSTHWINDDTVLLQAQGQSSDSSASRSITQYFQYHPVLRYIPPSLMTARLGIITGKQIKLWSESTTTQWSGSKDIRLLAMSPESFFNNFFYFPERRQQQRFQTIDCSLKTCRAEDLPFPDKPLWIEGDLIVEQSLGTMTQPALIFLRGQLDISNGAHIIGLIYIANDWYNHRLDGVLTGQIISAGEIDIAGYFDIYRDDQVRIGLEEFYGEFLPVLNSQSDLM